ncbi:smpa/omla domain-containing protein [Alicycliphilus sp. B1]|nr:smpa/omla domain-containing protein [Alicycliphilus sp. B1]
MLLAAVLAGCAGTGERLSNVVTPYKVAVVQGNFVSREQVQMLQPGMGRQQVREILARRSW